MHLVVSKIRGGCMATKGTNRSATNSPVKQNRKCPPPGKDAVPGEKLCVAVAQANKIGQLLDKRLSFDIDKKDGNAAVKVVDKSSGKVLRVLPPEEMLRMAAQLKKLKVLNDRVIGAAESVIFDNES